MATIPVTLVGLAYSDKSLNATPVTIVADLSYQGLVAGLPLPPPGRPPLGFWGGGGVGDYIDAGLPPGRPPGTWGGAGEPFPTPPIYIPRPPSGFPEPPTEGVKPPPDGGGWGYSPEYGWGYFPMTGGSGPKA